VLLSVLQCVAVRGSVWQCVHIPPGCGVYEEVVVEDNLVARNAVDAACRSVWQYVPVVAVCDSV